MAEIELINIRKHFGHKKTPLDYINPFELMHKADGINKGKDASFSIENLNLTIPEGKTMVVLGPTGCGKTTILRIIAGLEEPESGEVKYNGVNIEGTPPKDRRIGIVFQNYALYPHFTSKKIFYPTSYLGKETRK